MPPRRVHASADNPTGIACLMDYTDPLITGDWSEVTCKVCAVEVGHANGLPAVPGAEPPTQ